MYAVVQKTLEPLSIEQLRHAFRTVPGLTPYDANILGNDAFGILVKNFTQQQAVALQGSLRTQGIETEVVEQALLPALPRGKIVQQLEARPEHLLIYDPLGRAIPLEWQHVYLIAAGAVRLTEFNRYQERRPMHMVHGDGDVTIHMETDTYTREEENVRLIGEVFVAGGSLRYTFEAQKFNFLRLGDRRSKDVPQNFSTLVRDLCQYAGHAGLNRGAAGIRAGRQEFFSYPSRNAFQEELIWLLWQTRKPQ